MRLTLLICTVAFLTPFANADLVGGPDIIAAPAFAIDDPPGAVNTAQQAFNEMQGVVLPRRVRIDRRAPFIGMPTNVENALGTRLFIRRGTLVDSHMIFLNTRGRNAASDTATWLFDGRIIGVMSRRNGLFEINSSDILGAPGTVYPLSTFRARGLEGNDGYSIVVGGFGIRVNMNVVEPGDWIRVVTAPEPASLALLGAGALLLIRRRRKTA